MTGFYFAVANYNFIIFVFSDLSPPSMVSRLPYKGGPIPRMYPMIMGAEPFTPPPVSNVKQEGSIDLVGFQNAYSKEINQGPVITELPNVEELPKPPNTIKKQHVEKEDFPEKPKGLEIAPLKEPTSSEATKSFLVLPKPQPKKEQEKMEVDEPLDLSLPRKPKVVAVKKSLAQPGKFFICLFHFQFIKIKPEKKRSSILLCICYVIKSSFACKRVVEFRFSSNVKFPESRR